MSVTPPPISFEEKAKRFANAPKRKPAERPSSAELAELKKSIQPLQDMRGLEEAELLMPPGLNRFLGGPLIIRPEPVVPSSHNSPCSTLDAWTLLADGEPCHPWATPGQNSGQEHARDTIHFNIKKRRV
eukprot:CAMPEP_0172608594 /NCGR_PEP_ID=MMETSP1068-20121228/28669_1 /TAXON_ID=35684 /ORGANISM="Pseudopedinella elastica, Strain CCMP716" /LENGTH=128 /DNA_ID=CAMNT_0013411901 /DNA_START=223 /DNA_END=609 /DNA_ORIENTATION=-